MLTHASHFHGSDLEKIEKIYQIKKEDIISFSANVNPLGISPMLRKILASKIDAISVYPDREYTSLRNAIADYTGSDPENIIVGNGSTELISLFIQTIRPQKALILGPTYSEYEREISLCGGASRYYPLKEEEDFKLETKEFLNVLDNSIDLVAICNPNNPTSGVISAKELEQILKRCKKYHIFVMIDETYIEFVPNMEGFTGSSLAEKYSNLVIIRGISKFFASPGLRLGYIITSSAELKEKIKAKQNPWSINSLAEIAGEIIFTDKKYITETKTLINTERERIQNNLKTIKEITCYPSYANFILVKIIKEGINAADIFDFAIRRNCMIRDCSDFPFLNQQYFRFCFMLPWQNDLLLNCIRDRLAQ
jgi:threonine-phosphate decarboxylase